MRDSDEVGGGAFVSAARSKRLRARSIQLWDRATRHGPFSPTDSGWFSVSRGGKIEHAQWLRVLFLSQSQATKKQGPEMVLLFHMLGLH